MRIVIFELEEWEREAFKDLEKKHQVILTDQAIKKEINSAHLSAEIISASLGSDMSAESLQRFKQLKLICTRTTGFDHIDLNYCQQKSITVCNVPHYADCTVAEHVFALILAISHKIVDSVERNRAGNFSLKGLQGFDLRGKTLGVIGTGAIGRCVIEIARGFNMNILASDINPDMNFALQMGFQYVTMEELLSRSDIITLHVPSTPEIRNLLSKQQFTLMKRGAVLINTARGDLIDMQALIEALTSGEIATAGLDVLPEEPAIREEAELLRSIFTRKYSLEMLLADHVIAHLPNVIITPNTAFNTREAVDRLLQTTLKNIESFIEGKPQNVVTGYKPAYINPV